MTLLKVGGVIINLDAIAYAERGEDALWIEMMGNPATDTATLTFRGADATVLWEFLVSKAIDLSAKTE